VDAGRIEILFIIDYFHRTGGTEKHLAQLIAGLPSDAFRCSVVAFDLGQNPLLDGLRQRGVPVIGLPVGREYVPNAALQAWRLSRLIRQRRYDIVQTFHQKADTYGALIARLSGARHLISSKRDTGQLRKPWHFFLNRRLRPLFDSFIVVAEAVRDAVVRNDHLPTSRIVTIYNGVDTRRFAVPTREQRNAARAHLGFAADDFVVGMVAGFRPEKNHDVFFEGLERSRASIPGLKVLAVGAGPLLDAFREKTGSTAIGACTVFTGDVTDVVPYLWAMDVGCLTSGSNEGFSNAIIEQMSVGLPMIVTGVGGNAEAVIEGESGRVIPPRDAAALAHALIGMRSDPAAVAGMGRAARRRVEERFSLERMCAEHAQLYRSLCRASRRQG
jgi:glycosyltransferase involved in cell wall biosynthesis